MVTHEKLPIVFVGDDVRVATVWEGGRRSRCHTHGIAVVRCTAIVECAHAVPVLGPWLHAEIRVRGDIRADAAYLLVCARRATDIGRALDPHASLDGRVISPLQIGASLVR